METKFTFKPAANVLGAAPLTVFLVQDEKRLPAELKEIDVFLEGRLRRLALGDDFKASRHQKELLYAHPDHKEPRVVVIGLGKAPQAYSAETWEQSLGCAAMYWQQRKAGSFAVVVPARIRQKLQKRAGMYFAKGVTLGAYDFNNYKSDKTLHAPAVKEVTVCNVEKREERAWRAALEEGSALGASVNCARMLGDIPPYDMTPARMAHEAQQLAKQFQGLKVTVLDKKQMEKLKMGAVLGVNMGSSHPPKFIILEWMKARKKNTPPLVFAGKGITFDSGGISIKPADRMDEMKMDMMGGAAVIGALRAIAALKLPVNVVGLVPATENMPGGSAYRPGDILTGMGGKTIEVLNTDAEGRIILSDALEYAKRYKPQLVIDLATLTGACVRAVGEEYAGLFTKDAGIKKELEQAADRSNEPVWHLPLDATHANAVKSTIADVKNIAMSGPGASTAAAFLEFFVDYPWAHLDIAGPMAYGKPQPFQRQGARGFGVHLLLELARKRFKV